MESLAVIGLVFGLLAILTGVLLAGRWIWLKIFPTYGDHFSWLFLALVGGFFGGSLFGEFGALLGALIGAAVGALVDRADRTKEMAGDCPRRPLQEDPQMTKEPEFPAFLETRDGSTIPFRELLDMIDNYTLMKMSPALLKPDVVKKLESGPTAEELLQAIEAELYRLTPESQREVHRAVLQDLQAMEAVGAIWAPDGQPR